MTVISRDVGRGDIVLHRGCDERIGVRWMRDMYQDGWQPVDLKGWSATFEMYNCGEAVYSIGCTTTSDGYAFADIPGEAYTDGVWDGRLEGEWRINGSGPGWERELLAWGYYKLA